MATATRARKVAAGSMADYAQAPKPARASSPAKKSTRKLSGLRVEVAENGFTLRKDYAYTGDFSGSYEPNKERVFTDVDALLKDIKGCLGGK